jgi:hypothetical protein
MKFKIINLSDGSQKDCSLVHLSRVIVQNCEILIVKENELEAVGFISNKTLVFFALQWAKYALQNYTKKKNPKGEFCVTLVEKWLEDENSVSISELREAAYNADNPRNTAQNVAAYAAYTALYSLDPRYATDSNFYASAAALLCAPSKDIESEYERQANYILKFLEAA